MFVPRPDAANDDEEWRTFVRARRFGLLVASGRDRDVPVVSPAPFVLLPGDPEVPDVPDEVLLHLATPNPVFDAVAENGRVVLVVASDAAYVPAAWKAIGAEDPALGVPTSYYSTVQLRASATVVDDAPGVLEILRLMLDTFERGSGAADPSVHLARLPGIRGLRLTVEQVQAKFKYGGNVDPDHRLAVADRLAARGAPADVEARAELLRRLGTAGRGGPAAGESSPVAVAPDP